MFSLVQTFVIIPLIIYKWGKGAYCGWICSCGALAETLGDEYRTLAPHGPKAKRLENIGQWILLAAFIITACLVFHPYTVHYFRRVRMYAILIPIFLLLFYF